MELSSPELVTGRRASGARSSRRRRWHAAPLRQPMTTTAVDVRSLGKQSLISEFAYGRFVLEYLLESLWYPSPSCTLCVRRETGPCAPC